MGSLAVDKQSWILILVQGGIGQLQSEQESLELIRRGRSRRHEQVPNRPIFPQVFLMLILGLCFCSLGCLGGEMAFADWWAGRCLRDREEGDCLLWSKTKPYKCAEALKMLVKNSVLSSVVLWGDNPSR